MKSLEHYLKRATRGLYGTAKKDVWNELEQDVLERVRVARAFGLSEEQGLKRALEQLGDPREVSSGMVKTHTFPTLFKGLGLLGVASMVFAVHTLAPVRGQELPVDEWLRIKLEGAEWATDGLFDRYMAQSIERPAVLEGQRPDLAGRVIVAVTVTPSASSQPLSYYVDNGRQEVMCGASQPSAGAYTEVVRADVNGRFVLRALAGVVADTPARWVPRTLKEVCTPRAVNKGVFLALFEGGALTPLGTRLVPGTRLEPGKTYTL